MNKRIAKAPVSRAKERSKLPEPDLRTTERLTAAREISRALTGRQTNRRPPYSTPSPNRAGPAATIATKVM